MSRPPVTVPLTSQDYTPHLKALMEQARLVSFKALAQAAGVSQGQILQLRRGEVERLSVATVRKLSQVLNLSILELLTRFSEVSPDTTPIASSAEIDTLRQEYQRVQAQLSSQEKTLRQEFQWASLQTLESFLLQWPTAAHAAQMNPQAPAVRLLPLLRPLEQLLREWQVETIGTVGAEVAYDPQQHQLLDGTAEPGDPVTIRNVGYQQGQTLLYRAKVRPITPSQVP